MKPFPSLHQWQRRIAAKDADLWMQRVAWAAPHSPTVTEKAGAPTALIGVCAPDAAPLRPLVALFGGVIRRLEGKVWLQSQERQFVLNVGRQLVVASEGVVVSGGKDVLRIPAGMAFGTGEHATTAMCLRQLADSLAGFQVSRFQVPGGRRRKVNLSNRKQETANRKPVRIIDAGTGSGILALAASMLGASVEAFDFDPVCLRVCRANAKLNPSVPRVKWSRADVLKFKPREKADGVVANLFAGLLVRALPRMRRWLKPGGWLILSGILRNQEEEVVVVLKKLGLPPSHVLRKGKWVCLVAGGGDSPLSTRRARRK